MMQYSDSRVGWIVALLAVVLCSSQAIGQPSAGDQGSDGGLLLLVTEKFEQPEEDETRVDYWWSNPDEPQWTDTDRALARALRETDAGAMTPPGDVRVSRIYQTPDLSLDNAASLASLLGARRIVLGQVAYRPNTRPPLPGYTGLEVRGTLQVVDVSSSEPSVIRSLEVERAVYGRAEREASATPTETDRHPLAERARRQFSKVVGSLLDRTVVAASGEIGLEADEPLLAFRDLRRGRALEMVREFLGGLDVVDRTRIRWASEGRIAVEINPQERDSDDNVRYAARTLVNHDFDRMNVRRTSESEPIESRMSFAIELADDFDEPRRPDGEPRDNE